MYVYVCIYKLCVNIFHIILSACFYVFFVFFCLALFHFSLYTCICALLPKVCYDFCCFFIIQLLGATLIRVSAEYVYKYIYTCTEIYVHVYSHIQNVSSFYYFSKQKSKKAKTKNQPKNIDCYIRRIARFFLLYFSIRSRKAARI